MHASKHLNPTLLALLLALSLGPCLPTAATAAESPSRHAASLKVTLADLDLATPAGKAQARQRVLRAANRLCRDVVNSHFVEYSEAMAACLHDATGPALAAAGLEGAPGPVSAGQVAATVAPSVR